MRPALVCFALWLGLPGSGGSLRASDPVPGPKQDRPILLSGGTIHTVSDLTIPNGQILFARGQIVALGREVIAGPDAEIIDITGRHVYPGLIAAQSLLGLLEIGSIRSTSDHSEVGAVNPNVRAERAYNPDSEHIPVVRANGIALAHVTPLGGLLSGASAVMMLDGWTWEDALLRDGIGVWLNWPNMTINANGAKSSEEQEKIIQEALQRLDDVFDQAAAYAKAKAARSADLPVDLRKEALIPVLARRMPLFIRADHARQITAAINWTRRRNLRMVLAGGRDSWLVVEQLRENDIPVILGPVLASPGRRWEAYDAPYTLPNKLHEAGVTFCLSPQAISARYFDTLRNLPYEAAKAAAFGLPKDEALKAVTLYPARILGIADRVGALEPGMDATLMVTDGDPLEIQTQVERLYIQGRAVDLNNRHKLLYEKYRQRYRQQGILP